jgi:hypothetical protein
MNDNNEKLDELWIDLGGGRKPPFFCFQIELNLAVPSELW